MRRTIEEKAAPKAWLTTRDLARFVTALDDAIAPADADITARVTIGGHLKSIQAVWEEEDTRSTLDAHLEHYDDEHGMASTRVHLEEPAGVRA